jgi:alanine dehydrogenase
MNGHVSSVPVLDRDAVFAAVPAAEAIERTRDAFERHARGEWAMPPKVYVSAPPHGDFRAMPARGDGLAILKWVTSFPRNVDRGLPAVAGALLVSNAGTGALEAILDCAAVTSLRTGAAAAVSAQVLARPGARTAGLIGCGINGGWVARCLAAAGYAEGVAFDPRIEAAQAVAAEVGWKAGTREEAAAQDVVATVTPGEQPVILASDLRPGQHLAALGADAAGKSEVELDALDRCELYCDEWAQASAGGELAGAVAAGGVREADVTAIGSVLLGSHPGRTSESAVTLFDSTGLAIQDLGIAAAVLAALREGRVDAHAHVDL